MVHVYVPRYQWYQWYLNCTSMVVYREVFYADNAHQLAS